jgi:transglutaminase-like putative cysteine protease
VADLPGYGSAASAAGTAGTDGRAAMASAEGRPATEEVSVLALDQPWLPSVGWPRGFEGASGTPVGFDPQLGNLLTWRGDDANGTTYRVTATVPTADTAQLRAATSTVTDQRFLTVPADAVRVLENLVKAIPPEGGGYDRLATLAATLRDGYAFDPVHAPVGHSVGQLQRFLAGDVPGSAEQFATVFALAARQLGFPSRVVVGYRQDPAALAGGTTVVVSSRAVHAWAEVHFDQVGWAPFDPTPPVAQDKPPPQVAPVPTLTSAVVGAAPLDQPLDQTRLDNDADLHHDPPLAGWAKTLLGLAAALLVLVALLGVVPLAKALRRSRRRRGTPNQKVLGAWAETRDRLTERGVASSPGSTVAEVAAGCDAALGEDGAARVASLAPLVGRALYHPAGAPAESPAAAWKLSGEIRVLLRRHATTRQRVRAALDPRPLIGGRRRHGVGEVVR